MSTSTNNYINDYRTKVGQLVKTMIIKSVDTADAINSMVAMLLTQMGLSSAYLDLHDQTTWKYYMNLAGQYHVTDQMMTVVSMDNLETINFTIENLKIHRATARGYAYGTRQYNVLVQRYPEQEMLILGVLYPVDIDQAIAAPDWTILGYPPGLVEDQERSLIPKLQNWINGYQARFINPQYQLTDNLYLSTMFAIMVQYLGLAVVNFRLEVCKTTEAHSFHIRQYLGSHGYLDEYMDTMTLKQQLFFYRNIAYIERNNGKVSTFDTLVEHTMTERNLPLARYTMHHDVSGQPDSLYPEVAFKMSTVNIESTTALPDTISLETMLNKEDLLARDNPLYKSDTLPVANALMINAPVNTLQTKALESAMIDYTNATPYTLDDILLNHWLFLSSAGVYTSIINITNPVTGDSLPLTAKDAFAFYWYAFLGSLGITPDTVPRLMAFRVQRIPTPSIDDLMSVVNTKYISRDLATQAISIQPILEPIISTERFFSTCQDIFTAANMQRGLIALQENYVARGQMSGLVSRIYSDNVCEVAPIGESYTQWFADRNIAITDFSQSDLGLAYVDVYKQATGLSLITTNTVANLQKAMINMMTQLSSYSIQFMHSINDTSLRLVDWPMARPGDMDGHSEAHFLLDVINLTVIKLRDFQRHRLDVELNLPLAEEGFLAHLRHKIQIDIPTLVSPDDLKNESFYRIDTGRVKAKVIGEDLSLNDRDIIPVPGIEKYLALTIDQQQQFKDKAGNYWIPIVPQSKELSSVLVLTRLNGLHWIQV